MQRPSRAEYIYTRQVAMPTGGYAKAGTSVWLYPQEYMALDPGMRGALVARLDMPDHQPEDQQAKWATAPFIGKPVDDSLTVIIPCGAHHAEFVEQAYQSCLSGTDKPNKIIVIDDMARPRVAQSVLQRDCDEIVQFARQRGRSAARNEGIARAETRWLFFLDADDKLIDNAIRRFRYIIRRWPMLDLVYADVAHFGADSGRTHLKPFDRDALRRPVLQGTVNVFVRRERVKLIDGFDEDRDFAEEHDFWIRYCMNPHINVFMHTVPFVAIRKGSHSVEDAGRKHRAGLVEVFDDAAQGAYDKWAKV